MASRLVEIFSDVELLERIKDRLPTLFYLAEIESSRAGKVGMEVGSLRESILIAMLIYVFGEKNVDTEISIIQPETDVLLFGDPISIKTKTGTGFGSIKVSWTVDAEKALEFAEGYIPECDILLTQINWNQAGGLFYLPVEAQREVLDSLGREAYLKLPKPGTNPRGVEIQSEALDRIVRHKESKSLPILWKRPNFNYNKYKRWIQYWSND